MKNIIEKSKSRARNIQMSCFVAKIKVNSSNISREGEIKKTTIKMKEEKINGKFKIGSKAPLQSSFCKVRHFCPCNFENLILILNFILFIYW